MSHYRITPLEKKSIEVFYELYRQDPETGDIQWVNINELYRFGQAFIAEDMDVNLPRKGDKQAYCKMEEGEYEGCEFDDSIAVTFEFSDNFPDSEKAAIEESYYESGASWIYDGDHEWEIEDDYVVVYGPFKVELCEEDGTVIKEVELGE
jgi:hypothetical protein